MTKNFKLLETFFSVDGSSPVAEENGSTVAAVSPITTGSSTDHKVQNKNSAASSAVTI